MTSPIEMHKLTEDECFDLLRSQPVGRLVFTENALPAIRPVNFLLDGRDVVIRTSADSWVSRLGGAVVAFEVDQIDADSRTGWSVVVVGKASVITDIDALVRLTDPGHRPWAPGGRDRYLRVRAGQISGRRLSLSPA